MASSLLNSCEQGTVHAVVVLTSLSGLCIQMLSEYDLKYKHATTLIQKIGAVQFSLLSSQTCRSGYSLVPAAASNKSHCHCPVGPASPSMCPCCLLIQLSSIYPNHWLLIAQCLKTLTKSMEKSQKVKVLIDRPHQMSWHTSMCDAPFFLRETC